MSDCDQSNANVGIMNNIRTLRYLFHMTQEEFAEFCDISIVSISRYESGEIISTRNAVKIAKACHVSIDNVLNYAEVPEQYEAELLARYLALTQDEIQLLMNYRSISAKGQSRIKDTMEDMLLIYSVT